MSDQPVPFSRRAALKWLAGTAAASGAASAEAATRLGQASEHAPVAPPHRSAIYDPDFAKPGVPFETLLSPAELETTTALADLILPKDELGPAASTLGVPEFINEWISAPWDDHRDACEIIRGGLAWLNTESFRRFEKTFPELTLAQQMQIADAICDPDKAKPEHRAGAAFFKKFRQLCLGGYYTHSATWKQLGYIGNISVAGPYPGVPDDIIKRLGLEDVV